MIMMQNLISYLEYAIKFNFSSTKIVLLQFQKNNSKTKKTHYLINGEFYQKSLLNKKYVKFNFILGMLY